MNVATLDATFIEFASSTVPVGRRIRCALATLLVLASFTGALFMGWGWDDLLQLFSHPARATLLVALMLQLAFSVAQARPPARSTDRACGHFARILFRLFVAGGLLIVASSAFWDRRILLVLPGEDFTRYVGLGLFLMGLAINAWTRGHFRVRPDDVSISGRRQQGKAPFLLRRQSVQPGLLLVVIGLPMVFLSKLGLAGSVCLVVLMIVRVRWTAGAVVRNDRALDDRLQAA